jgi:hypothetical protein
MSSFEESKSSAERPLPIAFPLDPSPILFSAEFADKYGIEVYLAVLKANINYLKECSDAASRLYIEIGKILDNVKPDSKERSET